jgi:hypothetical protein
MYWALLYRYSFVEHKALLVTISVIRQQTKETLYGKPLCGQIQQNLFCARAKQYPEVKIKNG